MPDRQIDLTGEPIKFPTVRLANDFIVPWNRNTIIDQILQDTAKCPDYYNVKPASRDLAEEIAIAVESKIAKMNLEYLTGHLIRELTCVSLLELGYEEYANVCSRVGTSVSDAREIDIGEGYGAKDNANLQGNPETSHKLKADKMSKEEYLAMMPPYLVEAHRDSRLHIHDLEYFGTRWFCQSWDLRYFLYYGLLPDGRGTKASVSAPAKRAEVAVLHAVKVLGSAQTNFSGGEGFYNFLTFLAPYFEGLSYKDVLQLMQMFVYELTQMTVARGGQSLSYNSLLCIKENNTVDIIKIGDFCLRFIKTTGRHEFKDLKYETLSLDRNLGRLEWKPITGIYVHEPNTDLVTTILSDGRHVDTTQDHSLFTLDPACNFVEVSPSQKPATILTAEKIPFDGNDYDNDLMFLIGSCIGDGNLADNNGIPDSSMRIFVSNKQVAQRISLTVIQYNDSKMEWHTDTRPGYFTSFSTNNIPFIKDIGHGAQNKQIPSCLLSGSDQSLSSLLDGLLSTDGDVARRRYEYSTTSVLLANQIEFILRRLGLDYSIAKRNSRSNFNRNAPVFIIRISASCSSDIDITNSKRKFIPLDGPNQQKHDFGIIKDYIKRRIGRGVTNYGYTYKSDKRKLKKSDIYCVRHFVPDIYDKIRNILPMEVRNIRKDIPVSKFVYDIGVKDNENFVLHNGIIAHNTVFSSVQLTPGVPTIWKDKPIVMKGYIYDGKQAPLRVYGEFEREVRLAFKAIMEIMLEGDYWGKPFNFPKPEIGIEHEFLEEDNAFQVRNPDIPTRKDLYMLSFELASKFGTPYYDNMLPEYRGSGRGPSCYQCCAYSFTSDAESDKSLEDKMFFKNGIHFSMGAGQVITINVPRAAYEAEHDDDIFFATLREYMDLAVEIFKIKREWMNEIELANRIPFAQQRPLDPHTWKPGAQAVDTKNLTYVIGIIGMNEAVQHHMGKQLYEDKSALRFAIKTIVELNKYAKELSQKHGFSIGIARTPAETTAQRFAVADLLDPRYHDHASKVVRGDIDAFEKNRSKTLDLPVYYTNGTHLPVNAPVGIPDRIMAEHVFFPLLAGGNILHVFMGEKAPDPGGLMDFAMRIAKNTQTGYFAFTRDLTVSMHRYQEYKKE
jgi:anaerobic ribonucleoside-triphosphate reductase